MLWPLGIAAEFAALFFLFRGDAEVTAVAVVNRSVGGSFIACGLVAWQRRPDSRIGPLMTLTGFVFLSEALLSEVDSHIAYTLGQWSANWWIPPFAALVLGFPSGRLTARIDQAIIGAFVVGTVLGQLVWLFFLPFPPGKENAFLISADPGLANTIDRFESGFNATVGLALAILGIARWLRAAAPLRRLLLPTLAGAVTVLVLDHPDLLRGAHRRVHPRQPGGDLGAARLGAAGVPDRHPAPAARARRDGRPRRRAAPGPGHARAGGRAREGARRPVIGGRLLAPALRRVRRRAPAAR